MAVSPYLEADAAKIATAVEPQATLVAPSPEPALIVLVGLPGSGKTTFARRLAPLIDAVILQSDALRGLLFETPTHAEDESKRLFRAIQAATRLLLTQGHSVVVDATNLRETYRRPYYDIASRAGARLRVVHLTAPENVILNRLANRRETLDPNEASRAYEAVYALLQQIEEAPHTEHLRVDTSDPVAVDAALRTLVEEGRPLTAAGPGGPS